MMRFNLIERCGLRLSVVGFGTAQLRMVPEKQAIDTLRRGFELGVNWVHTASDYGGAEVMAARAIRESKATEIHMVSNAPGPIEVFEKAFEITCRLLRQDGLPLFGISGIDYCEDLGMNVWGQGGLIDFLQKKKQCGRLQGLFATTHGSPEYVARLINSGCFDALMIAYNPLGFHVLSYYGKSEKKEYEELERNREEIFPLAKRQRVALLLMKPLAGGLLCPSRAFPPRERFSQETQGVKAGEILQFLLQNSAVCAVAPGTADIAEAEENALAGHIPPNLTPIPGGSFENTIRQMKTSLCSRCGACEGTCSRKLPISWLFREGYLWNYPGDSFEALGRRHYFKLHPEEELACLHCSERTCICPAGLDIPASLVRIHRQMLRLRKERLMHPTEEELARSFPPGSIPARIILCELPQRLAAKQTGLGRLRIENIGDKPWLSFFTQPKARRTVVLCVHWDGRRILRLPLLHDVHPGERTHFAFHWRPPYRVGAHLLCLTLRSMTRWRLSYGGTEIHKKVIFLVSDQPHLSEKPVSSAGRPIRAQWKERILKGWRAR